MSGFSLQANGQIHLFFCDDHMEIAQWITKLRRSVVQNYVKDDFEVKEKVSFGLQEKLDIVSKKSDQRHLFYMKTINKSYLQGKGYFKVRFRFVICSVAIIGQRDQFIKKN